MSRVGKQPIIINTSTQFVPSDEYVTITGPKGTLTVPSIKGVSIAKDDAKIDVTANTDSDYPAQGLQRTLLQNAITGVNDGWKRDLELHGVGMRAALAGAGITLHLGFSHPITVPAPEGISFHVSKNVITVAGIDKQLVGETAANIRKLRPPEPYKGKGIRYSDEHVRRKAGKTGKAK